MSKYQVRWIEKNSPEYEKPIYECRANGRYVGFSYWCPQNQNERFCCELDGKTYRSIWGDTCKMAHRRWRKEIVRLLEDAPD